MSISTYENTPLLNYSAGVYALPARTAPTQFAGDYETKQAWPPIMTGTLRTAEVRHLFHENRVSSQTP